MSLRTPPTPGAKTKARTRERARALARAREKRAAMLSPRARATTRARVLPRPASGTRHLHGVAVEAMFGTTGSQGSVQGAAR